MDLKVSNFLIDEVITASSSMRLVDLIVKIKSEKAKAVVLLADDEEVHCTLLADRVVRARAGDDATCHQLFGPQKATYFPDQEVGQVFTAMLSEGANIAAVKISDAEYKAFHLSRVNCRVIGKYLSEKIRGIEQTLYQVGGLAHDARTPLSIVSLSTQFLLEKRENFGTDIVDFLKRIESNVERVSKFVKDILNFRDIDQCSTLRQIRVSANVMLRVIVGNLAVVAKRKGIQINFDPEEEFTLNIDREKIERVFENIMGNAIKFTPSGKKINIYISRVEREGTFWGKIVIADEGIGFDSSKSDQIFERYKQLKGSGEEKSGVGMGLHISKQYVERHGGTIQVASEVGKGTAFEILLPGAVLLTSDNRVDDSRTKILVVEDDEDIAGYLGGGLEEKFRVCHARDGIDGLEKFSYFEPDLVVTDIKMPRMDGLELLASIRLKAPDMPVILMSGFYPNLAEDLSTSCFRASKFLEKPFGLEDLVAAIEAITEEPEREVS